MPRPAPRVNVTFGATSYNITNQVNNIAIRRGRNRTSNKFEAGTADVVLYDQNGNWNPANTSSPYYGYLTPMQKIIISVDIGASTYQLFTGYIAEYAYQFATSVDDVNKVTLRCVDAMKMLAISTTAPAGYVGDGTYTGTAVNNILTAIGWSPTLRNIDQGNTTVQMPDAVTYTALEAIQLMENTEAGGFFVSRDGIMTFKSRDYIYRTMSDWVSPGRFKFADSGSGYPFNQATIANDDTLLLNQVSVTRKGGNTQQVSDATSITTYFLHDGVRAGVLLQSDSEALSMARQILATRKTPEVRVNTLTFNLFLDSINTIVCDYELLRSVEVVKAMPGNTTITNTAIVDAIHYDLSRDSMVATLFISEPLLRGFIVSDNYAGRLDYNVVAY